MKWSEIEIARLRERWPTAKTVEEIQTAFPNRTSPAIQLKAASLGLRAYKRQRRGDLTPLLEDTPEVWYWLGFFLADGHITDLGNFVITVNEQDEGHLSKLATLLGGNVKRPYKKPDDHKFYHVRLETMNKAVCDRIKQRLGLTSSRKTENPPNLERLVELTDEQLKCLFVGFFDGDGTRRAKGYGQFGCHGNWLPVFRFLEERGLVKTVKINSKGRVTATVPVTVMRGLAGLDIPKMERKWG